MAIYLRVDLDLVVERRKQVSDLPLLLYAGKGNRHI
jgi:hypothetical protein